MYEFKPEDAERFAAHIQAKTRRNGNELVFDECPYCHGKGKFNRDKFSLNLDTGVFNCFRASCNASGNMITLAKDFDFSLGRDVDEYYRPKKRYRTFRAQAVKPKPEAVKYLAGRGISEAVVERYQITANKDGALVFPFAMGDEVCYVKYRNTSNTGAKEWAEKDGKPVLFGMNQCTLANKTLVITEGQIDSLSVAESGIENAVSVPNGANGFTWVPHCWDWMQNFEKIIVFGDYEKGRITLLDEINKRFKQEIRHVRESDYKDCKDANDILRKYGKEQIVACVKNAVSAPVSRVIKLSSVAPIDIYRTPKLKTGISRLDGLLHGGLPFGYVSIITGKRGDGKSTFANQLMLQGVAQGYKTMIYSGELQNDRLQAWVDFQAAGRHNIIEERTDGYPRRFITKSNLELIHAWYDDMLYVYDNTVVRDEREDLLRTIEDSLRQYGAKVVLIDNLMIALDLDSRQNADKYERQSKFVKSLVLLAQRYDALILLVAHRRKGELAGDINDEVSGSSDITNLSGAILSYDRLTKKEIDKGIGGDSDRILRLSKNRLFGKVDFKGILLHFEEASKRVYDKYLDSGFIWGDNPFEE